MLFIASFLLIFLLPSIRGGALILKCYTKSESNAFDKCPTEFGCFSTRCAFENGTVKLSKGCAKTETASYFCEQFEKNCSSVGGESAHCYLCFDDFCNAVDYPGQNCSHLIAAGPLCFFIILMLLFFSVILAIISA